VKSHDYTELLCSLPNLVDPFRYQQHTISIVQLQKRMNMLEHDDYIWLTRFRRLFYWRDLRLDADEETLVRQGNRFIDQTRYDDIREWLLWRMDVRTIIAALRRKHAGESVPVKNTWGYGRFVHHIQAHWTSPCFGLEHRFTFLPDINNHLTAGDSYLLEKTLLSAIWKYCNTCSPLRAYSFSAIILYLMKWSLIDQWTQYDSTAALEHFNELTKSCLPQTLEINRASNA